MGSWEDPPAGENLKLNLHYDLSRVHQIRLADPHPLGNMPLVVLTASEFNAIQVPGMTPEQGKQDHLRLQNDLAELSTNSRHVMVLGSGHEVYLYKPAIVVHSISKVVSSVRNHSRLSPID